MIQMGSVVNVADNSGAKQVRIIKVLGHSKMMHAGIGDVVVASVTNGDPKGAVKMHNVVKGVVVRTKYPLQRVDGSVITFDDNAVVIVNKEETEIRATRVFGPVAREVRKSFPKVISLAPEVL